MELKSARPWRTVSKGVWIRLRQRNQFWKSHSRLSAK